MKAKVKAQGDAEDQAENKSGQHALLSYRPGPVPQARNHIQQVQTHQEEDQRHEVIAVSPHVAIIRPRRR